MTKKKHGAKRGRPVGGVHPANMREYWRKIQREYRLGKKSNVQRAAKVT